MELELSDGRVFGARYYTVEPKVHWYSPAGLVINMWREMEEWCIRTYGPTPVNGVWTAGGRWYANNSKFWFREHKDLEWFLLKWQ